MERQKFRIKRKNARFYGTATCSTTGTTGLWPLNFSVPSVSGVTNACSDIPIYSSLGVEVFNALNGDMTTFPEDIRNCSINEPCVILWNTPSPTFFPTNKSPSNGIEEIVLFIVVAGTKVPLKLTSFLLST